MLAKQNSCLVDVLLRICYSASSVTLDNFSTLFLYLPCLLRKSAVQSFTRDFRQLKTNQTGQTYQTHQTHENNQKHKTQPTHSVIDICLKYTTLHEEIVLLVFFLGSLDMMNLKSVAD